MHAYPVMNETKFPSRIDFGKCAVGETYTRKVKIECKVRGCGLCRMSGEPPPVLEGAIRSMRETPFLLHILSPTP